MFRTHIIYLASLLALNSYCMNNNDFASLEKTLEDFYQRTLIYAGQVNALKKLPCKDKNRFKIEMINSGLVTDNTQFIDVYHDLMRIRDLGKYSLSSANNLKKGDEQKILSAQSLIKGFRSNESFIKSQLQELHKLHGLNETISPCTKTIDIFEQEFNEQYQKAFALSLRIKHLNDIVSIHNATSTVLNVLETLSKSVRNHSEGFYTRKKTLDVQFITNGSDFDKKLIALDSKCLAELRNENNALEKIIISLEKEYLADFSFEVD